MAEFPKLYINQNVIVLIISFLGLGFSEFYKLNSLYWISLILSVVMTINVSVSMVGYSINYFKKKIN